MSASIDFRKGRRLDTLVENKTTYTLDYAEMNFFETHIYAERVKLTFGAPVLASMIRGKKIMRLYNQEAFPFLPGESLLLPGEEMMCIDFPEATPQEPTHCLAMTVSEEKVAEIVTLLNEHCPRAGQEEWSDYGWNIRFANDLGVAQIIKRLMFLFTENHPQKALFVEMHLKELLIRILQVGSRQEHERKALDADNSSRIAHIINFVRKNLRKKLTVKTLSQQAYMSESHFYRTFKLETGISPNDFIIEERLKLAAHLLLDKDRKITDVLFECGFNSSSYFCRMFKKKYGKSPKAFQSQMISG